MLTRSLLRTRKTRRGPGRRALRPLYQPPAIRRREGARFVLRPEEAPPRRRNDDVPAVGGQEPNLGSLDDPRGPHKPLRKDEKVPRPPHRWRLP